MKVSVIIPSLSGVTRPYLELCVKSLRATVDWQIIVVVNGESSPMPMPEIGNMCTILHTKDQGQCNATNLGRQLVAPDTDYIMVTNDDMYYAPGWNKNLQFNYPVFSPNLVEPTNNHGSAAPFLKLDAGFNLFEFSEEKIDRFVATHEDKEVEPGFNLPFFIRKDLWDLLGGYDTAYDPWGSNSDTDLQTRINLAGVTPMRLRDVLVYHFSNKSGTFDGTHQDFYQNNLEYFKSKFGFDRDELGSDVWYNKDMLPKNPEQIKYFQADYEG